MENKTKFHEKYLNVNNNEPVPGMSDNVVHFISNTIINGDFDIIVEYGSGDSTLFFLKLAQTLNKKILFLAVDMNFKWFNQTINKIRSRYEKTLTDEKFVQIPWSDKKIEQFLNVNNNSQWDYPQSLKRLPMFQNSIKTIHNKDSFIEYVPDYIFSDRRLKDSSYYARLTPTLSFMYFLRTEVLNDQYGESPVKWDYVDAGFKYPVFERLRNSNEKLKVAFIVDGGPRIEIINTILDTENEYDHFFPTILVHDAHRKIYDTVYQRRPEGKFMKGTNIKLNGKKLREHEPQSLEQEPIDMWILCGKPDISPEEIVERELWYYQRNVLSVQEQNTEYLDKAIWLFNNKYFEQCLIMINKIFETEEPNCAELLLMTSICFYENGNIDEAYKIFAPLCAIIPSNFTLLHYKDKILRG